VDLINCVPPSESFSYIPEPVSIRRYNFLSYLLFIFFFKTYIKTVSSKFKTSYSFMKTFFKCSAYSHNLSNRFHHCCECWISFRKFCKIKSRYLCNNIIYRRLKRCRSFLRYIVRKLVKCIPHSKFRRYLCYRETCSL